MFLVWTCLDHVWQVVLLIDSCAILYLYALLTSFAAVFHSCFSHSCVLYARKEQDVTTALRRFQCAACAVFSQHLSSISTRRFGSQVGWVETLETLETLAILEETRKLTDDQD